MRLINNTNKPNDRMQKCLLDQGKNTQVRIATAFFTDEKAALEMVKNNCTIEMIIRLDIGTSYEALKKIINNQNISIRYFTGKYFHPKFYIFGNRIAYLGSANFTDKGLTTNNEACVEIDSEEPVFEDLRSTFWDYWNEAAPLTEDVLEKFNECTKGLNIPETFRTVEAAIGKVEFNNVGRKPVRGKSKEKEISLFRKNYQLYIQKFNILKDIYQKTGCRKFPELPLRVEIDRFLWWIREYHAIGDSFHNDEMDIESVKDKVVPLIKEFEIVENNYLTKNAVNDYVSIANAFSSTEAIKNMNFEEMYSTLLKVHAFHDRAWHVGGLEMMEKTFKKDNPLEKIQNTISYLLFGKDDYEERIVNCITESEYKLYGFADHCITELYGNVNKDEIPTRNGRTLKSMEWLGFGKL